MDQHFLTIEQFNDLLKQWNGKNIKISKVEMDDYDETLMQLQNISYETNRGSIDDYEPIHSLKLIGDGKIQTDTGNYQDLPSSMYEIPLQDSTLYEFDGTEFLISTDRGVYKVKLQ